MSKKTDDPFKISPVADFIISGIGFLILGVMVIMAIGWIFEESIDNCNGRNRNTTPMTEDEFLDQQAEHDYYEMKFERY